MLKKLLNTIKNLDSNIHKILINGLRFSFIISIIACGVLLYYINFSTSNYTYYIGIKLMSLAISFSVYFFMSAIAFNKIKT